MEMPSSGKSQLPDSVEEKWTGTVAPGAPEGFKYMNNYYIYI